MSIRPFILLSLISGAATLQAATEFPNGLVPGDVASEFAGGTILDGLPADFPTLRLPGLGLELIGTMQRNEYSQQILLRSPLDRDVLQASLLGALQNQGWVDLNTPPPFAVSGYLSLRLCHDQHGELSINGNAASYGTRIQVSRFVYPSPVTRPPCSEQQAQVQASAARRSLYESLLPLLEVPEGTVVTPGPGFIRSLSSNYSSNSFRLERDGNIEVADTSVAAVFAHFATQMQAQGWAADSSNVGDVSATSVWTRSVTPPGTTGAEQVLATLTVLHGADDYYGVTLTLRSPPADGSSSGGAVVGVYPL